MKRFLLLTLIMLLPLSALVAETSKTITIENTLGDTVYYLYLSPVDEREWGEDRLGDGLLDPGSSIEVEISYDESQPLYDLMAEDEMEKAYRIENLNLDEISSIVISDENFLPFGGRNPVIRELTFTNNTGEDIYYLYISSRDSMYWGEDLLGDDIFEYGDSLTLEVPIDEEYPDNDILAEGESGSSYELMDQNMLEIDSFSLSEYDMTSSGEDDYYEEDYYDDYASDSDEYLEGYRAGFRDAWKEAYSQGFNDAMAE